MTLDDELRRRLQQAADRAGEGADAAALTQRVATASTAGTGAGWGRLLGGFGATGLVVGGLLGFTVLRPGDQAAAAPATVAAATLVGLSDCPQGAVVGEVHPGDRLFAVGRLDDNSWLAVRAPAGGPVTWLPATALRRDDDRDLPVLSCTETIAMNTSADTTAAPATTTPATTTTEPSPTTMPPTTVPATAPPTAPPTVPPTTAAPDTQQPTVQVGSNETEIYDASWPECVNDAVLTATATDNVGVTSVTGTWAGLPGSPKAFTKGVGNSWTMQFGPFSGLGSSYSQLITITVTARDAAGNTRTANVQVRVYGECLL